MESKKGINFFFAIIAIITGGALWKQFDFSTLEFEKPAIAIIYMIAFVGCMYALIKGFIHKPKKSN